MRLFNKKLFVDCWFDKNLQSPGIMFEADCFQFPMFDIKLLYFNIMISIQKVHKKVKEKKLPWDHNIWLLKDVFYLGVDINFLNPNITYVSVYLGLIGMHVGIPR